MPKINVYLPDDLAAAVREAGLSVSPICQQALAEAVRVAAAAREAIDALRDPGFDPQEHPQIAARVAARTTPHLRQAIDLARDLAGPSSLVGTTDLLVGAIDEPGNLGVQVLRSLDVDVPGLRDAAVRAGDALDREAGSRRAGLLGGLSSGGRLTLAAALEAATDLGHSYLGCEHLVLALAEQTDSAAGKVLRDLGIEPGRIRRAIPPAVAAAALGYSQARQTVANRLDEVDRRLDDVDARLSAGGL